MMAAALGHHFMDFSDIPHARLANLQLSRTTFTTPAEIVGHLGAMQAQDFAAAKWALGLRLRPTNDAAMEEAFDAGTILRTHVMRPTWHFVTPADIRWLLALTASRVHQVNGTMYRQVGMDSTTLKRCIDTLAGALEGGGQLTRDELRDRLVREGLQITSGQQMTYIMMNAELEGVVCSGPRKGKQFTYMLLDERAPQTPPFDRNDALLELIRRYFTSHGPATAADFARWSGLTLTDARRGLEMLRTTLVREEFAGQTYWFADDASPRESSPTTYLLSIFDEYTVGYKDHSPIDRHGLGGTLRAMGNALQNVIILDGQIAGTWRRDVKRDAVYLSLNPLVSPTDEARHAIQTAAKGYGLYLGLPVVVA